MVCRRPAAKRLAVQLWALPATPHIALTAAPDDANGADGDVAVALLSATELAGYKKDSGAWTQVWTFSGGGGGGGGLSTSQVQALIDATNLSALQGQVTDAQIPASIFRDAELTAQAVRSVLNLTNAEVNNLFTGASISGQVITFTQNDGSTDTITVPAGTGGMADGVVSGASLNGTVLTLTVTGAADVTVDLAALDGGGGGGGAHTEQRVLDQDPLGTADTFGKLQSAPNGFVYGTIPDVELGVLAEGDFLPFDHAMYIGAFNGDPNPLSVPAGTYYFEIVPHKLRKTALNAFGQLRWQDAPWSEILPAGARYRGNHDTDAEALHHLTMDGDVYHKDADASSRHPAGLKLRGRHERAHRLLLQTDGVRRRNPDGRPSLCRAQHAPRRH